MMMMMGFWIIVPLLMIGWCAFAFGWRPQYHPTWPMQAGQTPMEILKARYAREEISSEEYDQMRRDLEG